MNEIFHHWHHDLIFYVCVIRIAMDCLNDSPRAIWWIISMQVRVLLDSRASESNKANIVLILNLSPASWVFAQPNVVQGQLSASFSMAPSRAPRPPMAHSGPCHVLRNALLLC